MKPGDIVYCVQHATDATPIPCVIVTVTPRAVRVMEYVHKKKRWREPMWVVPGFLIPPPRGGTPESRAAAESVRKHRGVIPCGAPNYRYVRIDPAITP